MRILSSRAIALNINNEHERRVGRLPVWTPNHIAKIIVILMKKRSKIQRYLLLYCFFFPPSFWNN
jgi:hypothetical protein